MQKFKLTALLLLVAVFVSSCVSISRPSVLTLVNKTFPPDGSRYTILGEVSCGGTQKSILGLITWGGIEYLDLRDAGSRKYGRVDDVVSVTLDKQYFSLLGIFIREHSILRGTAIRYINEPAAPDVPVSATPKPAAEE